MNFGNLFDILFKCLLLGMRINSVVDDVVGL